MPNLCRDKKPRVNDEAGLTASMLQRAAERRNMAVVGTELNSEERAGEELECKRGLTHSTAGRAG